jgi:uncharacterized protein (TIGR02996 family)
VSGGAAGRRDESSLLAEIAQRLDDDGPREVFADLVAERGDPEHAELILLQLARAKAGRADQPRREVSLITKGAPRWLAPILPAISKRTWWFERGFLDRVTINPRRGAQACIGHPLWSTLRRASVSVDGDPAPFVLDPVMRNLRELTVSPSLAGLDTVLGSDAPITYLHGISLSEAREQPEMFAALREARGLPALARIDLEGRVTEGRELWSGGLDRPGLHLVFAAMADAFVHWWSAVFEAPPRHADVIVGAAHVQMQRVDVGTLALTVDPREVGSGLWEVALALGLIGRAIPSPPAFGGVTIRVPGDWQSRAVAIPNTPYQSAPQLADGLVAHARDVLGIELGFDEGTWPCDALADPRRY